MTNTLINYVEFKAKDLEAVKAFYSKSFGWNFTDYGPTYTAFSESGIEGGFEKSDETTTNGALVILYSEDLEAIKETVLENRGALAKDIYTFPGGRRFHFKDPAGNELAVWSDVKVVKCDLCEATAKGKTFGEWMENLKPHYMEKHADVMQDSTKTPADQEKWMKDNKARFDES